MKTRFLMSTAGAVVFATAAFAQAPNSTTTSPTTQTQTPAPPASTTPAPTTQKAPDTTTGSQAPSASTSTAPSPSTSAPQAQTTAPASPSGTSQPAQAQTRNPPPAAGQAQQRLPPAAARTRPRSRLPPAAPEHSRAAAGSAFGAGEYGAAVAVDERQCFRQHQRSAAHARHPVDHAAQRAAHQQRQLLADRGNHCSPRRSFADRAGRRRGHRAAISRLQLLRGARRNRHRQSVHLPDRHRAAALGRSGRRAGAVALKGVVHRQGPRHGAKTRQGEDDRTSDDGQHRKVVIRRGERLPDSVEFEEFPETVYRDAPALREYRYIHRENRTYLIDPGPRTVIEEID